MFSPKTPINYLTMVPTREVKEFTEEQGKVTLLVPKFKNPFFTKLFIPKRKSPYFRIHLDEMGSSVWKLIDGKRNVGEICQELSLTTPSSAPDNSLELRVTKFLTDLYKSRFIRFLSE